MGIPTDGSMVNLNQYYIFKEWFPREFIDQFIRKLPFYRLEKPTMQVAWNHLSTGLVMEPYEADATLPSLPLNFAQRQMALRRIGDTVMVDQLSQIASGNLNDLLEAEIRAKQIAIVRNLGYQTIMGDGIAPNLNGLISEFGTVIDVSGAETPTLHDLNRLAHKVLASDGCVGAGADCIVTHERVLRFLVSYLNSSTALDFVYDPDLGVSVPRFRGIPMYIGQVPSTGASAYDIWALKISGPTGIRMLHATGGSNKFGIEVIPIPMQTAKAQVGAFVGGLYGLMVPEPNAIVRLAGTTDAGLTSWGVEV